MCIRDRRSSLPKDIVADTVTLEIALELLSLPREVGVHPDTGDMITAGIGRFGPYIKLGPKYASLKDGDDVLSIGLNRAVTLLAEVKTRTSGRELGTHQEKQITVRKGRFGPYVKWDKINATLPSGLEMDTVTLEEAVALVKAKAAKPPAKKVAKKKATKKRNTQKSAAKRKSAKKAKAEPADAGVAD